MKHFHESMQEAAESVRLTDAERARMRAGFLAHMQENPLPAAAAARPAFLTSFSLSLRSGIALVLGVLVVGAGGTAYAAEDALPGDALYAVKLEVNEPLAGALAITPAAKGAWHADVAETRLAEAQTLVAQGRLTASTSDELAADFAQHAGQVDRIASSLESSDPDASASLTNRFSATLALRGAAILAAGTTASDTDKYTSARFVRAAVGTQSSELAINDMPTPHTRPVLMKVATKQAAPMMKAMAPAAATPAPQAKAVTMFAVMSAPATTTTDDGDDNAPQTDAQDARVDASVQVSAAAQDSDQDDQKDADAALARAIARAAGALDDARDTLDASTTAAFDAQLADLRLTPLAVAADAAAGDEDSVDADRAQGLQGAGTLEDLIQAAVHAKHSHADDGDTDDFHSTIASPDRDEDAR